MNQRLFFLSLIAAGCVAAIESKLDADHAKVQNQIVLESCQNRPKPDLAEAPEEIAPTIDIQVTNPLPVESEPPIEESIVEQAEKDPALAAKKAETFPAGYGRVTALNQVATVWAGQDPTAALSWAGQLSDPDDRKTATSAALFKWGEADPQKTVIYAEACDLGDQARSTLGILVQKWAASDLSSAVTYVSQQPAGEMKNEMLSRVAPLIAAKYPDLAGQIVSQSMPPGPAQTEAAISVVHQWARLDPDGATAWAEAFPSGGLKERALKEIAGLAEYQPQ